MSKRITNWSAFKSFLIGALVAPFAATGALPQIPAGLKPSSSLQQEARADLSEKREQPASLAQARAEVA